MNKAMTRRLRLVEEDLQRRRPINEEYNATALLKQKLDQMADRLRSGGNLPEPMSPAELQAFLARWRADLADRQGGMRWRKHPERMR